MDSTVIQEIANQLGMAVDQAGQFIQEQLPQFAALKAMQNTIPPVGSWSIFAAFLIIGIVFALILKFANIKQDSGTEDICLIVIIASFILAGIMLLISLLITAVCVPKVIGWSEYPQAMLIDMALKAVQ